MFIIYGWGRTTTKRFGPVFENFCSNCNSKEYWELCKITVWFTIFFIPLIPYEIKYFLLCPVCECGIKLDRQKFDELHILATSNVALINGQITQSQYVKNLYQPSAGYPVQKNQIVINNNDGCFNCNQQNAPGAKFCKNCGVRL